MPSSHLHRLRAVIRREFIYIRAQLMALGERRSPQWLELRQIAKATLAAVLAWSLASLLLPREATWIAPATAVIMVHATVYKTLTNGLRRVVAVAVGVILAGGIGSLLGLSILSLVLVVPPALVAARWRQMGRHGSDVATTAVLMLSFGAASQEHYLLAYLLATAIGTLCGIAINIVLWPPLYRRRPAAAMRMLSKEAASLLRDIADGLRHDWDLSDLPDWRQRAVRLDELLPAARAVVADGAESRRYNLRRVHRPANTDHAPLLHALTGIRAHTHSIIRVLDHHGPEHGQGDGPEHRRTPTPAHFSDAHSPDFADLLELLADIITARIEHADDSDATNDLLDRALAQYTRLHKHITEKIQVGTLDHPQKWAVNGSLLTDAQRVLDILDGLRRPPS
jgi:uncharacterized membrane protein YccC